jgi:hypothetical protein
MSYLRYFSPQGFLNGILKTVICLNHTNIHIPHIFPTGFLEESKITTTSISRRFD